MQTATALLLLIAALLPGIVSPGPCLMMVVRVATAEGKTQALWLACGIGIGGAGFSALALMGLQAALLAAPVLFLTLKLLGGLYLGVLGVRMLRSAALPPTAQTEPDARRVSSRPPQRWRWLLLGFSTHVVNPKTLIVYASVFAATLPAANVSWGWALGLLAVVFSLEAGWYALVTLALSAHGVQQFSLPAKTRLDRVAGCIMLALALGIIAHALWEGRGGLA